MLLVIFIKIFLILFYLIRINIYLFKNNKRNYCINKINDNSLSIHEYHLFEYFKNHKEKKFFFNLINIKYNYSLKFNLLKVIFNIKFFDENKNLISPSDLTLYYNVNIICIMKIINNNIQINSLPNIYLNKYFECVEFFQIKEEVEIGIKIEEKEVKNHKMKEYLLLFFSKSLFNFKKLDYINDKIFDFLLLNNEYLNIIEKINDIKNNEKFKLKKTYLQFPLCNLKRNIAFYSNRWKFNNIYNNYFCFCKGFDCPKNYNLNSCKYYFYLNIIDNNRNVYKKEDYFFLDFVLKKYSFDDVFPIFKQMEIKKFNVHYLTENKALYNEYCFNKKKCLTIIYVENHNFTINALFLEKYLTLLLKLKCVVTAAGININYINNLFYNIEYITYICVGHGISFFKYFLYGTYNWYGHKLYDKLLLPPSEKLIYVAKSYGWDDKNIIKINLPKWDKYNYFNYLNNNIKTYNNSILIMFTWRSYKKNKYLSKDYFKNILNLINNDLLNSALKNNSIILYFTLHHKLSHYKDKFLKNNYIHFLKEFQISECLSKINLLVTDFSSIIFDIIYRKKPFVLYIPDAYDPEIEYIYDNNYYELIQCLKNGSIYFENKYFNLQDAINKIKYYIKNDFTLEANLEKFYESFEFKQGYNINIFINYITNFL